MRKSPQPTPESYSYSYWEHIFNQKLGADPKRITSYLDVVVGVLNQHIDLGYTPAYIAMIALHAAAWSWTQGATTAYAILMPSAEPAVPDQGKLLPASVRPHPEPHPKATDTPHRQPGSESGH